MNVMVTEILPLIRQGVLLPFSILLVFSCPTLCQTQGNAPSASSVSLELNEKGIAAIKAKDFQSAEKLFKQALATDNKNITAAFNLAGVLLTNKKGQEAVELLTQYTNAWKSDAGLFARLGDAQFSQKNVPEAAKAYEKALEIDRGYPGVAGKLGTVYGLLNRSQDSEKMLLLAIEQNPRDGRSMANLSSIFLANGDPQKAIATAKRALQIKATSEIYVTLGTAYEILKDNKNALISFQRAVDLGDKRELLITKIEELKKTSGN